MIDKVHPHQRLRELPATITNKDQLHDALRVAMELELSTIPPYLTALYSIKPGTNAHASAVIQSVVIEEMLHLTLAGNVLAATGGHAAVDDCHFVPQYPTRLPRSAATFTVPLASFSKTTLATFKRIEHPGPPKEPGKVDGYLDIGQFYAGIENGLRRLNKELGPEQLYDGDPSWQVQPPEYYGGSGEIVVVVADGDDPNDRHNKAIRALKEIVNQGEGLHHAVFDGDKVPGRGAGKGKVPAHYFRFDEIVKGCYYQAGDKPDHPTGAPLDVDWSAVYTMRSWPSPPKPHESPTAWYAANGYPDIAAKLHEFNVGYMNVLHSLQAAFTGRPHEMMRAVTQMYDLKYQAQALLKIPDPNGTSTVGPSFECIPTASESESESNDRTVRGGSARAHHVR